MLRGIQQALSRATANLMLALANLKRAQTERSPQPARRRQVIRLKPRRPWEDTSSPSA
jgi:hypothetical protein